MEAIVAENSHLQEMSSKTQQLKQDSELRTDQVYNYKDICTVWHKLCPYDWMYAL